MSMRAPAPSVTILEALPQLLPAMDADAVAQSAGRERTDRHSHQNQCQRQAHRAGQADGCAWSSCHDGTEHAAEADRVVNGAGRIANVDTLDLAAGNVEQANGRVSVDHYLRSTSNPHVHVCGDALPISPQLSPLATYEGDIVGRNIVEGPKHSPDYEGMPTSVYTVPALAAVGLTEAAAPAEGLDDRRSCQRHARLVFGQNLCRDGVVVEDHRRPQRPTASSARISSGMTARS